MAHLTITLEEGFSDDSVVVSVNGATYRRDAVRTKLQIGMADQFELDLADGSVVIDVSLPGRQVSGRFTADVTGDLFIGVSVDGGALRFRHSSRTFGYV